MTILVRYIICYALSDVIGLIVLLFFFHRFRVVHSLYTYDAAYHALIKNTTRLQMLGVNYLPIDVSGDERNRDIPPSCYSIHDEVMTRKYIPHYCPFVTEIHLSLVDFPDTVPVITWFEVVFVNLKKHSKSRVKWDNLWLLWFHF